MASDIVVSVLFTENSGEPATGLLLADIDVTVFRRRKSDGTVQTVLTAVNPTEEVGGGIYTRAVASADVADWDYFAFAEYTGVTTLDVNFSLQADDGQLTEEEIWNYTTRTLTSFGTLVADIWTNATRTLTSFGTLVSDIWSNATRTLTSFGTLVADIWSNATRTLTSFGTLVADIWTNATRTLTSFGTLVADIWAHTPRTLTQSAAQVAAGIEGSDITILRGDRMSVSITGLGDVSSYVSLDFTVKEEKQEVDDDAIIRIRLNLSGSDDGLLRFNRAAVIDSTKGSITIDNAGNGDITVELEADLTDDLALDTGLYYDVQMITATTVLTLTDARLAVAADVTRAVV